MFLFAFFQEMARARGIQQQMYPGMFRGTDVVERYRAAQQVKIIH